MVNPGPVRKRSNTLPKVLDLRLLGSPEILLGGIPPRFGVFRKTLALLALLASDRSRDHDRAHLAEILWPEKAPDRAADNLCQAVYSLRQLFGRCQPSPLIAGRSTLRFDPGTVHSVDLELFTSPPDGCPDVHDPANCPRCADHLSRALASIRGPFLEGFSLPDCEEFDAWTTAMREDMLVRSRIALDPLIRLREQEGNLEEAIFLLDHYLRMDPIDELRFGQLLLLLERSGRRLVAEQRYERLKALLNEQIDAEPAPETQEIIRTIRAGGFVGVVASLPAISGKTDPDISPEWRPAAVLFCEAIPTSDEDGPHTREFIGKQTILLERAKTLGDFCVPARPGGFLVWFGIEGRPEGSVRRALRAGWALRELFLKNSDGEEGGKSPALFRGALHSGRAIRRRSGVPPDLSSTLARETLALGYQSEPGTLLVSQTAAALLKKTVKLECAGDFRIPGKTVPGYVLREMLSDDVRIDRAPERLVGRHREVDLFTRLLDQGSGGVLVVEGEAGIGKTALARTLVEIAEKRGFLVRTIEGFPEYMNSPFHPMIRLIRGIVGLEEGCEEEVAHRKLLEYVRGLGHPDPGRAAALLGHFFSIPDFPDSPLSDLSPLLLREESMNLALSLLRARIEEGPALILAEDLHFLDASTGEILRRALTDPLISRKVLSLLTVRSGESPSWLGDIVRTTLRLDPLSEEESRLLVNNTLGSGKSRIASDVIEQVVRAADGIPLFIEELSKTVLDSSEEPLSLIEKPAPETLDEVLSSRLDRLAEAKPFVQRAAVFGRTVPVELLRRLSPESEELFADLLDRATRSGLVRIEKGPTGELFVVRHVLIAEAACRSLTKPDRADLNRRIAEILRSDFPVLANVSPELVAQHFEGTEDWKSASDWYERAARRALSRASFREALNHAERALLLLRRFSTPPVEGHLLFLLGKIRTEINGLGTIEVGRTFRESMACATKKGFDTPESFLAGYGHFRFLMASGSLVEARAAAELLSEAAETMDRPECRTIARFSEGCLSFWEGDFSRSLKNLKGEILAAPLSPSEKDPNPLADEAFAASRQAMGYRAWSLWFSGHLETLLKERPLIEQWSGETSDPLRGFFLSFSLNVHRYLGERKEVGQKAKDLLELSKAQQSGAWIPPGLGFSGWVRAMDGDPGGILPIIKSIRASRKTHRVTENVFLSLLAESYLSLGDFRKARGTVDSALRFSKKFGTGFFDAELLRIQGQTFLLEGDRQEAKRCFREALRTARARGARMLELRAATDLGKILSEEGKRQKVQELLIPLEDLLEGPESTATLPDIREARELVARLV